MRGAFEKIAEKKVSNDQMQQELDELNNKFQEDIERSKRMINRNKDEMGEEIMRINEQMRLAGENIESTKTVMKEIDFDTKTNTSERKNVETSLQVASRGIRTNEKGIKG